MHLYIEEIDLESLKEFTEKLDKATKDEHIDIYISSTGGAVPVMEQYVRIINRLENPCTLFAFSIQSCAFDMYMKVNKPKSFASDAYWLVHATSWNIDMISKTLAIWDCNKFKLSTREELKPLNYLTTEENERYLNGDDVYLNRERLREIFWF